MMTRFLSAETLLAISFIRSGIHTLTLESIRLYGMKLLPELEKKTGCGWILQWSGRYLEEIRVGFVELDEDVAELTTDTEGLGKVLGAIPCEVLEVAEQIEWEE